MEASNFFLNIGTVLVGTNSGGVVVMANGVLRLSIATCICISVVAWQLHSQIYQIKTFFAIRQDSLSLGDWM